MFSVKRILVPIDFSEVSRAALSAGMQMANQHSAELYILHVEAGMDKALKARLVSAPNDSVIDDTIDKDEANINAAIELEHQRAKTAGNPIKPVSTHIQVSGGDWLEVALQMVQDEEIDLVVSGTHGPKGLKGLLTGSVTEKLVHRAVCSVLVVKPQGYPYLRD